MMLIKNHVNRMSNVLIFTIDSSLYSLLTRKFCHWPEEDDISFSEIVFSEILLHFLNNNEYMNIFIGASSIEFPF